MPAIDQVSSAKSLVVSLRHLAQSPSPATLTPPCSTVVPLGRQGWRAGFSERLDLEIASSSVLLRASSSPYLVRGRGRGRGRGRVG
jgi:hypothetical protein